MASVPDSSSPNQRRRVCQRQNTSRARNGGLGVEGRRVLPDPHPKGPALAIREHICAPDFRGAGTKAGNP
jgi:hypothetical protein